MCNKFISINYQREHIMNFLNLLNFFRFVFGIYLKFDFWVKIKKLYYLFRKYTKKYFGIFEFKEINLPDKWIQNYHSKVCVDLINSGQQNTAHCIDPEWRLKKFSFYKIIIGGYPENMYTLQTHFSGPPLPPCNIM